MLYVASSSAIVAARIRTYLPACLSACLLCDLSFRSLRSRGQRSLARSPSPRRSLALPLPVVRSLSLSPSFARSPTPRRSLALPLPVVRSQCSLHHVARFTSEARRHAEKIQRKRPRANSHKKQLPKEPFHSRLGVASSFLRDGRTLPCA